MDLNDVIRTKERESETMMHEPPHNTEAEQALLGTLMKETDQKNKILDQLKVEDFYHHEHQTIFKVARTLHNDQKPIDAITLTSALADYQCLEAIGGAPYILAVFESVTTLAHTNHYIQLVLEESNKRKLLIALEKSKENIHNPDLSLEELVSQNKSLLDDVNTNTTDLTFKTIKSLFGETVEQIQEQKVGGITGLKTGFDKLDYTTNGLQDGHLIILAARPSMGKTAFALNIAQNVSHLNNVKVAVFSLEMSGQELATRMISSTTGIHQRQLKARTLDPKDWQKIKTAKTAICELDLYIDDTPGIDITKLRSRCISLHHEHELGLVVVDYLQLIRGNGYGANRVNEVSEVSRTLKEIARELNVPVLALSQLSRGVESREERRPVMSDLRDSGGIEQDADIVIMMYRGDYYKKPIEAKDGLAEIIFRKHRSGALDHFKLSFDGDCSLFQNIYDERV